MTCDVQPPICHVGLTFARGRGRPGDSSPTLCLPEPQNLRAGTSHAVCFPLHIIPGRDKTGARIGPHLQLACLHSRGEEKWHVTIASWLDW